MGSVAFKLVGSHTEVKTFVDEAVKLTSNEKSSDFFKAFFNTKSASFGPLAAFVGGIVG